MAKVNDHWCDQLDTILGVNSITREDFLHWGSAKWEHTLQNNNSILSNFLRAYRVFNENFVLGVSDKDNRWIEQPLFYNPNILNAKMFVLRPSDYNIPETRAVSKLKVIDIFRNLKVKEINELAEI